MIALIIIAVCLIVIGIAFLKEKGTFLIASYNIMSPKEKRKIDFKKLYKYMAILMFLNAACFLTLATEIFFGNNVIHLISLFSLMGVI